MAAETKHGTHHGRWHFAERRLETVSHLPGYESIDCSLRFRASGSGIPGSGLRASSGTSIRITGAAFEGLGHTEAKLLYVDFNCIVNATALK